MSGLVCDKCRTIIKYLDAITEEDRQSDYHLCERCNPKPESIQEIVIETSVLEPKARKKRIK